MKVLAAFVALVFVPAAALAQVQPLNLPTLTPIGQQSGITVQGRGVVRVRADDVRVTAFLTARSGASSDAASAAAAIVEALKANGVPDAVTGIGGNGYVNGPESVVGTVHTPTRERVTALIVLAAKAAAAYPAVTLQNLQFALTVDDCSAGEERAIVASVADARVRAGRVAKAANVALGRVVNMTMSGLPAFGCATRPDSTQPFNGNAQLDPSGSPDIVVTAFTTMTSAIAPGR